MRLTPTLKMIPFACGVFLLAACADQAATAVEGPGIQAQAAAAPAADGVPDTRERALCTADEEMVFGCALGPELSVAVCAARGLDSMQYREGPLDGTAQLAWPEDGAEASQAFRSGTLMYSGGGGAYLRFDRDGQAWTVYTGVGRGWEQAGVLVEHGGEAVRDLACRDEAVSTIGPELFERAGIPADADGFEIPVISTAP